MGSYAAYQAGLADTRAKIIEQLRAENERLRVKNADLTSLCANYREALEQVVEEFDPDRMTEIAKAALQKEGK